jgi:hypothetical protein
MSSKFKAVSVSDGRGDFPWIRVAGDTFDFTLSAKEGYGEVSSDAIVELPIDMFKVDGKIEDGLLTVGNVLPMQDSDGNRLQGTIDEIKDRHKSIKTDLFRFSGTDHHPVKLKLSMLAANLLMEEFPLSEKRVQKIADNEYIFEDFVCSFEGVGRFVLGLCNEVEVLESKDFLMFLNKKRESSKF